MIKKFFTFLIIILVLATSVWLVYEKFFNQFSFLQDDVIEIVFAENIFDYSPYTFIESNNQRLGLIYEPLVKLDETLQIVPALANSYGRLDDLTWEFSLNPQAKFHDGTPVRASLVEQNFINYNLQPGLKSLVSSIETVKVVNDLTLTIKTKYPDASLLNKIALLYIAPNLPLNQLRENPVGTGPYKVARIQQNKLSLLANTDYYGRPPTYPKLVLTAVTDQFERNRYASKTDRVVMVYPVAAGFTNQISNGKFTFVNFPTSTVNFFLFNLNRPKFRNQELRKFFKTMISDDLILQVTEGLGKPTSQYVSQGVFGYNPDIQIEKIPSDQKMNRVKSRNLVGFDFKIALPAELAVFSRVLINYFNEYGILPEVELIEPDQMLSTETMQNFDLIFLGWKSDYGDSTSFFENIAVSNGGLNLTKYSNSRVDNLLVQSQKAQTQEERLQLLREAMKSISIDNPIGIPLFESETIYAIDAKYQYTPRVDGFIDPNNLKLRTE